MSSDFVLTVATPDKTAEISVYDSEQNRAAQAVGNLRRSLPAGLYQVTVRLGPAAQERLVSLNRDTALSFVDSDLRFPTPVPLAATARTHEYHQAAAVAVSAMPAVNRGQGATILVFARGWSVDESAGGNPMAGLSLYDCQRGWEFDLSTGADIRSARDASAGNRIAVDPGAYRLRLRSKDGTVFERMLIAVQGWQTQIFLLTQDRAGERQADLPNGAIVMGREGRMFDPTGKAERAAVLARYALIQRQAVASSVMQDLYEIKFEDPLLGLLAAHLVLREQPRDKDGFAKGDATFDEVLRNLRRMLGDDHPDVLALGLRAADARPMDIVLRCPPLLRASWDLVTTESVRSPHLIPDADVFHEMQKGLLPSLPWLTWQAGLAETEVSTRKVAALRTFVAAYGNAVTTRQSSPEALGSVAMSPQPSAGHSTTLGFSTKVELARTLGVSGNDLERLLDEI